MLPLEGIQSDEKVESKEADRLPELRKLVLKGGKGVKGVRREGSEGSKEGRE